MALKYENTSWSERHDIWQFKTKGGAKAAAKEIFAKLTDGAQETDKQVLFDEKTTRGTLMVTWNAPHTKWSIRAFLHRNLSEKE